MPRVIAIRRIAQRVLRDAVRRTGYDVAWLRIVAIASGIKS
ncbi:hypothetical protein BSIN_0181 [Burkholderia singularis]|uniref:Uncharacterized protein n=1 Tax=Burkholderia singularis TaxID=1503053 RepID=A0A238H2D8_9BURK|nr:hypothetical protein BSIN_0181 [Burkholderia singularis]